jgi:hypothetical protein
MVGQLPAGLTDSSDIKKILDAVSHQADMALNMMVGLGETRLEIQLVPPEYLSHPWDYTGVVCTEGDLVVTVGCGLSCDEAHYLSAHMMGMEIADDDLVLGCLQELLNVVLGGAIGPICEIYPVKMGLPRMGRGEPMAVDHHSADPDGGTCVTALLHLACSDVHLDLYVSIKRALEKG